MEQMRFPSPQRVFSVLWKAATCGLLTTVLISWTLGVLAPDPTRTSTLGTMTPSKVHIVELTAVGRVFTFVRRADLSGSWREHHSGALMTPFAPIWDGDLVFERLASRVTPDVVERFIAAGETDQYGRYQFGWPFLALACERGGKYSGHAWDTRFAPAAWDGGVAVPRADWPWLQMALEPVLPMQPLWSGLFANISLYTAIWLIAWIVPERVLRLARTCRGRCPTCGYELVGNVSGRCPECGQPCPTHDEIASGAVRRTVRKRLATSVTAMIVGGITLGIVWSCWPPSRPVGTLQGAIERADFHEIRAHLYWGENPNRSLFGSQPLIGIFYNSAHADQPDIVRLLISYGADVNAPGPDGWTPLYCAAYFNCPKSVGCLLRHGASVDARADDRSTPLLAKMGSVGGNDAEIEVVRQLLAAGADLEARDDAGQTALLRAIPYGSLGLIRYLLEHGADVTARADSGVSALHLAVDRRDSWADRAELLTLLSPLNAEPAADATGFTALHAATGRNQLVWMRDLLRLGADPNARDNNGESPLFVSVRRPPLDNQRHQLLLDAGADVCVTNIVGETLLHAAVSAWWDYPSAYDSIRFLVHQGVDINQPNDDGRTPFQMALTRPYRTDDHPENLKRLLIELGADPTPAE